MRFNLTQAEPYSPFVEILGGQQNRAQPGAADVLEQFEVNHQGTVTLLNDIAECALECLSIVSIYASTAGSDHYAVCSLEVQLHAKCPNSLFHYAFDSPMLTFPSTACRKHTTQADASVAESAALSPGRANDRAAAKATPRGVALTSPSIQVSIDAIVLN